MDNQNENNIFKGNNPYSTQGSFNMDTPNVDTQPVKKISLSKIKGLSNQKNPSGGPTMADHSIFGLTQNSFKDRMNSSQSQNRESS